MRITIHRGIDQIGGCITEISTATTRLLIDLGQNLPNGENTPDPLGTRETLSQLTEGVDAILFSHYHGDHIGLFNQLPTDTSVQLYIGRTAKQVCKIKHTRLAMIPGNEANADKELALIEQMKEMQANRPFKVGNIRITPYFVSHSAYESFLFLIEADGKRVIHTGDFRDHGHLGNGLRKTIKRLILPKGTIDVLITEGTLLGRQGERIDTEPHIQQRFAQQMKRSKNCFVICSSTDMERLASIHAAHKQSKPTAPFVCDDYQADILCLFTQEAGDKQKDGLFRFETCYTFAEWNAKLHTWMLDKGFTMLIRSTDSFNKWLDNLLPTLDSTQTTVVFSMWKEYINPHSKHLNTAQRAMIDKFPSHAVIHTSGHATPQCLAWMCQLINPTTAIIPIHVERSEAFLDLPIHEALKRKVVLSSTTLNGIEIKLP